MIACYCSSSLSHEDWLNRHSLHVFLFFYRLMQRLCHFVISGKDLIFYVLCLNFSLSKGRSRHGETVEWTSMDLLKGFEEFVPINETRPIKNNMHGMGLDQSFGLWSITQWLKPDLMIESGAFKGYSK